MKPGSKLLYRCGTSALLLLLVRGAACDSWQSFLFNDDTGETVYSSPASGLGVDRAQRRAQMAALASGVSPVLVPVAV